MKQKNGRLIVLVAAVAVAAVAVGGALAYSQGPQNDDGTAGPLPVAGASSTPSKTPSATPSLTPSTTPSAPSGPVKVKVNLAKLPQGRDPQLPYLFDREVRGGAGGPEKIPGKEPIHQVARLNGMVLAVVSKGLDGSELLKLGPSDGEVNRIPDVDSIVTSADGSAAAYSATKRGADGGLLKGGTIYIETDHLETLKLPNLWSVEVLALVDGKVYFAANDNDTNPWQFYSWTPGAAKPTEIKVGSPTAVSDNGELVSSMGLINDGGSCSDVTQIATGKRLWKTCESSIDGFTPDGATAFGGPSYRDGYADGTVAALNGTTGRIIREWQGIFHQAVPEDDQHLLIVADTLDGGGESGNGNRLIIRCDITTGACERATPLTSTGGISIGR